MPQITIDVTAQQAARLTAAFGKQFNLRDENGDMRDATQAEIKKHLVDNLKSIVHTQEHKDAEQAIVVPEFGPT